MTITILLRNTENHLEGEYTLTQALQSLAISPELYLAICNGKLLTEDALLQDGDVVNLIGAITGG